MRLVHDPVGQAIIFELYIGLFYLFVLGVRSDCLSQPRGPKGFRIPEHWCTDGVAASVTVFGAYGPSLQSEATWKPAAAVLCIRILRVGPSAKRFGIA